MILMVPSIQISIFGSHDYYLFIFFFINDQVLMKFAKTTNILHAYYYYYTHIFSIFIKKTFLTP